MLDSKKLAQNVFRAAVNAVKAENTFLRGHCEADGYHGIGSVSEPVLMHLVFRALITRGTYDARLAQPYPGDAQSVADLVVVENNVWAGCIHAKWLATTAKVGAAKDDMDRMRTKLPPQIAKLLLAFWVKERPLAESVDRWVEELAGASGTAAAWTETFNTLSSGSGVVIDVTAGVTLFQVV
jgi:hypothetical protein